MSSTTPHPAAVCSESSTANGPGSSKTCFACGSGPAPGKRLMICSGCLSLHFCNVACQKAAWPKHRPQCTRCKKLDVVAASPLLAAFAHLPRLHTYPKMLAYEVFKRERIGCELHLHLRNRGELREPNEFDQSDSSVGPSLDHLHFMMQQDGYIEASTVGSLYGFHCAVQQFNANNSAEPAPLPPHSTSRASGGPSSSSSPGPLGEYVTLCEGSTRITKYGISVGSTAPATCLVYHVGPKVAQLQDPNNHVWMYFSTGKSDRLLLDLGSVPYGVGFCLNVVPYLPDGTPDSDMKRYTPMLGAPGLALGRQEIVRLGLANEAMAIAQALEGPGEHDGLKKQFLKEHTRIPISHLPVPANGNPRRALRDLLTQVRQAGRAASSSPSGVRDSRRSRSPGPRGSLSPSELAGLVGAVAVVTREAMAAGVEGAAGGGAEGQGAPDGVASVGASTAAGSRRSGGGAGGSGGRTAAAGSTSTSGGGVGAPRIPFRDGKLDKHVVRAVAHFECAFMNTMAVLEQATYQRYPASPASARYLAECTTVPRSSGGT